MRTEFNDFTQPCSHRPWERDCQKKKKTANVQRIASIKTFFSAVREQIIIRRQLSAMT